MTLEDKAQHLEDLQKMVGWHVLLDYMQDQQRIIKERLLSEKNILKIRQLQDQHSTYQGLIRYVTSKGRLQEEETQCR